MTEWNSKQYLKFEKERTQPAIDLANRITLSNPQSIIDIGCGPGNSTNVLRSCFPNSYIVGIDKSKDMIMQAKKDYTDIDFMLYDAGGGFSALNRKFDVVFSNACIQWIPDHNSLLRNMMDLLNDNGVLAVQIPINFKEPIHKIISNVTKSEKWKIKFHSSRVMYNLTESEYFDLIAEISSDFCIWTSTYFHRMRGYESIIEWYRGTGLRPYLEELSEDDKNEFEYEILSNIKNVYKVQKNGEIIFKFPRLFFIAVKGSQK